MIASFWAFVAWLLSLVVPADMAEAARCSACVTVAYAAQANGGQPAPTPPEPGPGPTPPKPNPKPEGCVEGCDCGGTGWVTSPDGFRIPCPCPAECKCKQTKRGAK